MSDSHIGIPKGVFIRTFLEKVLVLMPEDVAVRLNCEEDNLAPLEQHAWRRIRWMGPIVGKIWSLGMASQACFVLCTRQTLLLYNYVHTLPTYLLAEYSRDLNHATLDSLVSGGYCSGMGGQSFQGIALRKPPIFFNTLIEGDSNHTPQDKKADNQIITGPKPWYVHRKCIRKLGPIVRDR